MTKNIAIIIILLLFGLSASSVEARKKKESAGARPAFGVGDKTIALALGFGTGYNYSSYYAPTASPTITLTYDQGIIQAGPGVIGIGGMVGAKYASYKYAGGEKQTYSNYMLGLRGTYHLSILKDKNHKFDPYGGLSLGVRLFNYKDHYYNDNYNTVYPVFGLFVGARYNFSEHFGAFSELGYDMTIFRIGINLNF